MIDHVEQCFCADCLEGENLYSIRASSVDAVIGTYWARDEDRAAFKAFQACAAIMSLGTLTVTKIFPN